MKPRRNAVRVRPAAGNAKGTIRLTPPPGVDEFPPKPRVVRFEDLSNRLTRSSVRGDEQNEGRLLGFTIAQLSTQALFYLANVGLISGFLYYRDTRDRELRAKQLQEQLVRTQLQMLRMQLNPHFLFNTMNAIGDFMHRDVEVAQRMMNRLSDLLRMALTDTERQIVPLSRELATLNSYIEIEKLRFGNRLKISLDIHPNAAACAVPNMILQPLVENAITHGVGQRADLGEVTVSIHRKGDHVDIRVSDDGPGLPEGVDQPELGPGLGLSNTVWRVERLYGARANVSFERPPGGGFLIAISIPYEDTGSWSDEQRPSQV